MLNNCTGLLYFINATFARPLEDIWKSWLLVLYARVQFVLGLHIHSMVSSFRIIFLRAYSARRVLVIIEWAIWRAVGNTCGYKMFLVMLRIKWRIRRGIMTGTVSKDPVQSKQEEIYFISGSNEIKSTKDRKIKVSIHFSLHPSMLNEHK